MKWVVEYRESLTSSYKEKSFKTEAGAKKFYEKKKPMIQGYGSIFEPEEVEE